MAVTLQFKFLLGVVLAATLGVKFILSDTIENPGDDVIAAAVVPSLEAQGFQSAGPSRFADRDAVLVGRERCLMYVVPVAQQGWYQATVRHALSPDQQLWFVYDGVAVPEEQPCWLPLTQYYLNKALKTFGIDRQYPSVVAVAATRECDVSAIKWPHPFSVAFNGVRVGQALGNGI